jgi:dTDP-4-dehydrorhamnose reductase
MKLLITGGDGQLGCEFARLQSSVCQIIRLKRAELDIAEYKQITQQLADYQPDIVVNTAAYTAVDHAEQASELAFNSNSEGPLLLAQACSKQNIPLIHLSTDYVFDGQTTQPYEETAIPAPLNVYGASKLAGEMNVREYCQQHIILRVSGVFGVHGHNFVKTILRLAREKELLQVVDDQIIAPTPAAAIAEMIIHLSQKIYAGNHAWGIYHYCGSHPTNWYEFAQKIVAIAQTVESLAVKQIMPISSAEYYLPAKRPAYSILNCGKIEKNFGIAVPAWEIGLLKMLADLYGHR